MVKKGYLGPELPNNKVAQILIYPNIYIESLDGKSYQYPWRVSLKSFHLIDILPGAHSIKILPIYAPSLQNRTSGICTKLDFTAEVGDTYEPKFVVYNICHEYNKVSYQTNSWIQNGTKYRRGLNYFNNGQYEKAITLCNKVLERAYCPDTHSLRGSCYTQIGEYSKAISDFTESIKISPEPSNVYLNRGFAYFNLGNYSQAVSDYNVAMKAQPSSKNYCFQVLMHRASAYLRLGDKGKAYSDLMQAGELNSVFSSEEYTPLMFALRYNQPESAKVLIEKGADIKAKNNYGWTPLMMAIKAGDIESVKILIEAKADVNCKTDKDETPLQEATALGFKEIIFILKEAGAN